MLQETTLPERRARFPSSGPAAKLSRTPTRVRTVRRRRSGAHTDEILAELGVCDEERKARVAGPASTDGKRAAVIPPVGKVPPG